MTEKDNCLINKYAIGNDNLAKNFIKNEYDINKKNKISLITSFRDIEIMEMLLEKGADVNFKRENGWNVIMCIVREKKFAIKKLMLIQKYCNNIKINEKNNLGMTALMIGCAYSKADNIDMIEYLIGMGADINLQDNEGNTALMISAKYSAENSCYEVVITLINYGADIEIKNNENKNVLDIARESDKADERVIKLLEKIIKKN